MENQIPLGCVVMAAGSARRFGANKLTAEIGGRTLIRHALEAVPADRFAGVCVVTQYEEIAAFAEAFGFTCLRNDRPEEGISRTVRLGTAFFRDRCEGILFMTADQPFLRRGSIAALVDGFREHPSSILALAHDGCRGNPCVFPKRFFPELCELTGDRGGSVVIRAHPEALLLVEAQAQELADIDTVEDLHNWEK